MTSLGNEIYSGSAQAGQIFTTLSLVIAAIIGIIAIIIGIVLLFKKNVYTSQTPGTITSASCMPDQSNMYTCNLNITYTVSGKEYKKNIQVTSNIVYQPGSIVTVWYEPTNPDNFTLTPLNYKMIGLIMIGFSILIIGISYFWYWAAQKSKFIAAGAGVSGVWNMFRR